jgi:mono/diheme cytochrome c family protein
VNGKRLFEADGCYQCHGYAAQGGRDGPRLAATALNAQALIRYVRRPFGAMPAFTEKVLSEQDLTDIHAYLKAFPVAKAAKDIPLLDQLRDK